MWGTGNNSWNFYSFLPAFFLPMSAPMRIYGAMLRSYFMLSLSSAENIFKLPHRVHTTCFRLFLSSIKECGSENCTWVGDMDRVVKEIPFVRVSICRAFLKIHPITFHLLDFRGKLWFQWGIYSAIHLFSYCLLRICFMPSIILTVEVQLWSK